MNNTIPAKFQLLLPYRCAYSIFFLNTVQTIFFIHGFVSDYCIKLPNQSVTIVNRYILINKPQWQLFKQIRSFISYYYNLFLGLGQQLFCRYVQLFPRRGWEWHIAYAFRAFFIKFTGEHWTFWRWPKNTLLTRVIKPKKIRLELLRAYKPAFKIRALTTEALNFSSFRLYLLMRPNPYTKHGFYMPTLSPRLKKSRKGIRKR